MMSGRSGRSIASWVMLTLATILLTIGVWFLVSGFESIVLATIFVAGGVWLGLLAIEWLIEGRVS